MSLTAPRGGGSSPLSRGIHELRPFLEDPAGIIPALAGNTPAGNRCCCRRGDHPRSRGEYPTVVGKTGAAYGSSPLSRGILQGFANELTHLGIIPALAGNTSAHWGIRSRHGDHPRSRGEYPVGHHSLTAGPGSSPLSRGIRRRIG